VLKMMFDVKCWAAPSCLLQRGCACKFPAPILAKSAIFLPLTSNSSLRHRNDPMNAAQSICTEAVKRIVSRASQLGLR
jgi:hypothetical protein